MPIEGGPQGNRVIANVVGGTFEGPRLRGRIESPGAVWLIRRPDGNGKIDVRATLRTDDGAVILMTYSSIRPEGERIVHSDGACSPRWATGATPG